MKKALIVVVFVIVGMGAAAAAVTVNVSLPQPYSSDASPVHFKASASGSYAITGWHIYVDGNNVFGVNNTATIDTYVNIAQGTHQVVVRAWDSSGAYGSVYEQITVQGTTTTTTSALPTPPSSAKVFSGFDDMTGWGSCGSHACAGGSGNGSYWMAGFQTAPSLDGASIEFYNSGAWSNALWWKKVGANDWASNFLWDFYFQVDQASLTGAQALEFDVFQFIGGYNYMIGSQCNYAAGLWDVWDAYDGHWIHTAISCPKFSSGVWHHIQWYVQRAPNTLKYHYVTLVVDGRAFTVNATYSANYKGWGDNLGAQYQLDVDGTGVGYHEWVDKSTLTIW
jgi:hypothetical protein